MKKEVLSRRYGGGEGVGGRAGQLAVFLAVRSNGGGVVAAGVVTGVGHRGSTMGLFCSAIGALLEGYAALYTTLGSRRRSRSCGCCGGGGETRIVKLRGGTDGLNMGMRWTGMIWVVGRQE